MKTFFRTYWKHILVVALLVSGGVVFFTKRTEQKTSAAISTAKVTRRNFAHTLTSSGKTKADKAVDLKFQVSGKLAWVGVKEGDAVSAYQSLAKLDTREVQKDLEKTLRDYSSQRNEFEQTSRVTYDGKTSYDAFTDTVKRLLEKNQWDLEKTVLDVELKQLSIELSTLTTPMAGIVTHIDTPVAGVNITPASAVFSVVDPASVVFDALVDETDIGGLTMGQNATIALDAFPEATYSGKISYISFVAEQSSGGSTVFPVKIAFDTPQNLRIGLNGDMTITTQEQNNVLSIPAEAIREEKGTTYVYKKTSGAYTKTTVQTGARNEDDVVITRGLSEGDVVVTRGFTNIPK